MKKTHHRFITEVGCLRFVLLNLYRAFTPHIGALSLQQQMQAPMVLMRFTQSIVSQSGRLPTKKEAVHQPDKAFRRFSSRRKRFLRRNLKLMVLDPDQAPRGLCPGGKSGDDP
jgi:hypothetical protein